MSIKSGSSTISCRGLAETACEFDFVPSTFALVDERNKRANTLPAESVRGLTLQIAEPNNQQ